MPRLDDEPGQEKLAKRCGSCRPLGIFYTGPDEFLLCYNGARLNMLTHRGVDLRHAEFGLWVNGHGNRSRTASGSTVEWEGTAKRAAHHHPYVLLFDSRFIEIRNAETGRLAQIVPGNDIRCIWDGRDVRMPSTPTAGQDGSGADSGVDHKARVHVIMNAPEQPSLDGRRVAGSAVESQQVVELIPTIPLPVAGPAISPGTHARSSWTLGRLTYAFFIASPRTHSTLIVSP
jgi:hypothetical protein